MIRTIAETLLQTRTTLAVSGVGEAPLEAELLLGLALGMDRSGLYASLAEQVSETGHEYLERLVRRRQAREPLAYLAGKREFFGLEFKVGPGVFIPRPETELLVEHAISLVQTRFHRGDAVIADVGTGSGSVAVSLAVHLSRSRLYGSDISETAIATARANAEAHGVEERITFLNGDLLKPLPEVADLVVANLPYLRDSSVASLEPEISRYEPRAALNGGVDGLDLVRRLLCQAPRHLHPKGALLLELDPEQMDGASRAALDSYPEARLYRLKDLAGSERVLVIDLTSP